MNICLPFRQMGDDGELLLYPPFFFQLPLAQKNPQAKEIYFGLVYSAAS